MLVVSDWLEYHAKNTPEKTALIDDASDRHWTYAYLNDRCNRLAGFLRSQGICVGDRVVFLAYNCCEALELLMACQKLGAIFVPLNWRLAKIELRMILEDCEPSLIVVCKKFKHMMVDLGAELDVPLVDMNYGEPSAYEQGIQHSLPITKFPQKSHDDTWIIMYTSGTTGRPKGACISHENVLFTTINHSVRFNLTHKSRNLAVLPLFHVGGLFLFTVPLLHMGGSAIVVREFDPGSCLDLLVNKELEITHIFAVPTIFLLISQLAEFESADLQHLEHVMVGGAPAPERLLKTYALKKINVGQGFGMTETATTGTALAGYRSDDKLGSSGLPSLYADIRLVGIDGKDVFNGEVGEIWIKGPAIFKGYWRRPEEDAKAFVDGWFRTGDAATIDNDGYYYIVDRWKDMFISGGENIYPAEIENVIYQHHDVAEVAVIGVPDNQWGEAGCAFVVPKLGSSLEEESIIGHCRHFLGRYKVPKIIIITDAIPHNAAGKVLKPALREKYKETIDP